MSFRELVLANLWYHRRMHAAVALGVAVGAAVLTGALLVGDSVRGSLRELALDRLGKYNYVIVASHFFRSDLTKELAVAEEGYPFPRAVPAILVVGTVEYVHDGTTTRAGGVTVLGVPPEFWSFGSEGDVDPKLKTGQIALNQQLAGPGQLDVQLHGDVILRIGQASEIPADSPLGRKSETTRSRTLAVSAILPNRGLGRFGISPSQQLPLCAFVDLATLQEMLDAPQKANAILIPSLLADKRIRQGNWETTANFHFEWLQKNLRPKLSDYGLSLQHVTIGDPNHPVNDYFNLTSQRMMLDPAVLRAAENAWHHDDVQPALTFLANDLESEGRHVPYSTITAIDPDAATGPLVGSDGNPLAHLADNEIVLTDWAADDLRAKPGDTVRVTYFEPETTHGKAHETAAEFRLKAIVPLAGPDQPPRRANDPALTPELKGVTDKAAIADWNPPFPFDGRRIRPRDERYWKDHRTTPKAYVSLTAGRKMWASRFGNTTSLRVAPGKGITAESLERRLVGVLNTSRPGFQIIPVKQNALLAASGTTPFDVLFLLFSMFLMISAIMLLAILFRLGVDQRAGEIGVLRAVGFTRRRVRRLFATEGLVVAAMGGLLGAGGGILYAWLLLTGLRTWWLPAIGTPFLQLHVEPRSLLIGAAAGALIGTLTIFHALRQIRNVPIRSLLSGVTTTDSPHAESPRRRRVGRWIRVVMVAVTLALMLASTISLRRMNVEVAAALFFIAGAFALATALLIVRAGLRTIGRGHHRQSSLSFAGLAWRNVARNPARSSLTIGLTASACYLIVATSAFQLDTKDQAGGRFNLLAESSVPVYHDLGTEAGRFELGIVGPQERQLASTSISMLRAQDGDDASCLNLYRPRQPRILGVPPRDARKNMPADEVAHMLALRPANGPGDPPRIGVVLDENTARYSLGLWRGVGETFTVRDGHGQDATLVVVGLLQNSVFQGSLLINEADFLKLYPDVGGYRYFLIDAPAADAQQVAAVLEDRLGDFGFDVTTVRDRMAGLLAVQNTYLSTFQFLGALGLLLGTVGLAVVQLRSVLEQRGELAVMQAAGFRRRRLASMVLLENGLLLITGLGIGVAAAMVSVAPHWLAGAARLPWLSLGGTLFAVAVTGLVGGLLAVRATLRAPLLAALRGE